VKTALNGLGFDVNDVPSEVISCMNQAVRRSVHFSDVDMSLMPGMLVESLLPFQRIGVEFAIQRGGKALICDDMGLGKTIQGIAVASYYMSEWPCLVLAQSSLKRVWSSEFEKWIPGVKGFVRVVESGAELTTMGKVSQITIMAYDLASKMSESLHKLNFKVILADESHMLKSVTAQRTKALVPLLRKAKRTILLSGTPALSRPSELFPQLLALESSIWPTMKGFGIRYCNAHQGLHGWDYSGNSNLIELNALLSHTIMIRRLKDTVLSDLPPKVRKIVEIERDSSLSMDPIRNNETLAHRLEILVEQEGAQESDTEWPQEETLVNKNHPTVKPNPTASVKTSLGENDNEDILAMYREASVVKQEGVRKYVRKLVAEETRASSIPSPLVFPTLLDEAPSLIVTSTSFSTSPESSSSKDTTSTSPDRKFLLFAHHLPMLDVIESELKSLKIRCIRIDGDTPTKDRALYVKQFQEDDAVRAAVLSLTCASTGLTLTSASLVVFAELYWNPGTLIQAEDRVHRLGQTAPFVELRYLFCKGTVDDVLWPLIGKKLGVIGSAINGAKDRMTLDGANSKTVSKSKITAIVGRSHVTIDVEGNGKVDSTLVVTSKELEEEGQERLKKRRSESRPKKTSGIKFEGVDMKNSVNGIVKSNGGAKGLVQRDITSYMSSSSCASFATSSSSSPSVMDPIVIDDSQESVTPKYVMHEESQKVTAPSSSGELEQGLYSVHSHSTTSYPSKKRSHELCLADLGEEEEPSTKRRMTVGSLSFETSFDHQSSSSIPSTPLRDASSPSSEVRHSEPMRSKTTEWAKTRLSFLSPAPPIRLGFKK